MEAGMGTEAIIGASHMRSEVRDARRAVAASRSTLAESRAALRITRLRAIHLRYETRRARRDRVGTVLCMAMPAPEYGESPEVGPDEHPERVAALMKQVAHLETALDSRDVIGQAKGILMERFGIDADTAFAWLRDVSQARNEKVRALAQDLAQTGEWPHN